MDFFSCHLMGYPKAWGTTILSAYMSSHFLHSSNKWDHAVFVFLYLPYFIWQNSLPVHLHCHNDRIFIFLILESIPGWLCSTSFLYWWTLNVVSVSWLFWVKDCNKHNSVDIALRYWCHLLWLYTQYWAVPVLRETQYCFPQWQ